MKRQGGSASRTTQERFRKIQQIFGEAADLPRDEQGAFVDEAVSGDDDMRREVLGMLEADTSDANSLLDVGIEQLASEAVSAGIDAVSTPFENFGPYRLLKLLGEGGMCVVYLAERRDLGSQVAVKFLRDAWLSPTRRERFASEQRLLAQLTHPLIARLYDAGALEDGTPWFAMEYVEGIPITAYSQTRGLSAVQRIGLFREVCEAVRYAHEHAVIHRDLKPSNILVKADGEVRLLDFGIAKRLENAEVATDQTRTEQRWMTPAYAAPEQMRGEPVGVFTDVYALGVILYELLTGRGPYNLAGATPNEAERRVLETVPEKPSVVALHESRHGGLDLGLSKSAWADLDVLCATALQKDAPRRYRSVEALLRDVDHFTRGEALEARRDRFGYRTRRYLRRNRRSAIVSVAVVMGIVALVSVYTMRLAAARNSAERAALRMRRVQDFTINLFQGGEPEVGPSESMKVLDLLKVGERSAAMLNQEPEVQADLYQMLGNIYYQSEDAQQAERLFQNALKLRKVAGDNRGIAETLESLCLLRGDEENFREAERLAKEALERAQTIRPKDDRAIGMELCIGGKALSERGQYVEALAKLREAERLQSEAGGSESELSYSLGESANAQYYMGNYAEADSFARRVLAIDRKRLGKRNPNIASDLANLGTFAIQRGQFAEAERLEREALSITQDWFGPEKASTAGMMISLGEALAAEGKADESEKLYEKALEIRRRVFGPSHLQTGMALSGLGRVELQLGELDEAEKHFGAALVIFRATYHEEHPLVGTGLVTVASVFAAKHEYRRASDLQEAGLRIFARTLPPDHKKIGMAEVQLGDALVNQRRFAEAEAHTRKGYAILSEPKNGDGDPWIGMARKDLALIASAAHP